MFLANFFFGCIVIGLGVLGLRYHAGIVDTFGKISFLEFRLGQGTTYFFYQFLSILVIIYGVLIVFDAHGEVMQFFLWPLINLFSL